MSKIRLFLDEDVPVLLAKTLRSRGWDVVHATEVGLGQRKDPGVFEWARADGRAVLTHNIGDFIAIVHELGIKGEHHPGLALSEQLEFRDLVRRTARFLAERDAASMVDAVVWLVK